MRVSVSKVSGFETLSIAKKWCIKISIIQLFLFVVFAGQKQPKQKNARNLKKFQVRSDDNIFFNSAKCTNFEVSSLGLGLQVSSVGLEVFDEVSVSSRNFNQVSVLRSRLHHWHISNGK